LHDYTNEYPINNYSTEGGVFEVEIFQKFEKRTTLHYSNLNKI